jgi:hypothetical protein
MIARVWRGRVHSDLLIEYREYIARTGLTDYRATPGNRDAYMLTRDCDGYSDVITFSLWDSLDSIVAFAGDDVTLARYYPEDERFLLDRPERVEHYDVTE